MQADCGQGSHRLGQTLKAPVLSKHVLHGLAAILFAGHACCESSTPYFAVLQIGSNAPACLPMSHTLMF